MDRASSVLLILVATAPACTQGGPAAPPPVVALHASSRPSPSSPPASSRPTATGVLGHPMLIGASVTAGFWAGIPLLEAAIRQPHDEIETIATSMFGAAPEFYLKSQLETAQRREPTLIIGMDALFWFLYQPARRGLAARASGTERIEPAEGAAARLLLLDKALALLSRVSCPLVVGEIPDMRDVRLFIRPEQLPGTATLARANQRIRGWAKERRETLVLPLATWVEQLRSGTMALPAGLGERDGEQFPADVALGPDRLHPSETGQMLLSAWLVSELAGWLGATTTELQLDPQFVRGRLRRGK